MSLNTVTKFNLTELVLAKPNLIAHSAQSIMSVLKTHHGTLIDGTVSTHNSLHTIVNSRVLMTLEMVRLSPILHWPQLH
jgi:hypothetical protein